MYLPKSLKQLFSGQNVNIYGSAPSGTLRGEENALNVFVNGAIGRCEEVDGIRIGFVNEQLFSAFVPDTLSVKKTRELIIKNSSKLDCLVICPSNPYFADSEVIKNFNCRVIRIGLASSHRRMARTLKSKYLPSFPNGMVSTGIRALVIAFSFGAKSAELHAFSLSVPQSAFESHHFYDPPIYESAQKPRNHASADAAAIALLSLRGHKIETDSQELKNLLYSFGILPSGRSGSPLMNSLNNLMFRGYIPDIFVRALLLITKHLTKKSGF